jgi:hypothetical protein
VEDPSDREPPARVQYRLEEAREALITTDHLAEAAQVEHQIRRLSRRLGFDEPGGDGG